MKWNLVKELTLGSQVGLRLDRTFCTLQAPESNMQPNISDDATKYLTWCDQT